MNRYDLRFRLFLAFWMIIFIVFMFFFCGLIFSLFGQTQAQIEQWRRALVWANYEGFSKASGFFVSHDGIVVIPYHIVGKDIGFVDGLKIYVMTYEREKVYEAKILAFFSSADLIFAKIEGYYPKYWFDEFESPKQDMKSKVLGFPLRWRLGKDGRVICSRDNEYLGVDIEAFPGMSGSVVISLEPDSFGKVLMMISKSYGYAVGISSVIIQAKLRTVLKGLKNED